MGPWQRQQGLRVYLVHFGMITGRAAALSNVYSPIFLGLIVVTAFVVVLAISFLNARDRPKRKSFDVGGPFDRLYSGILPNLKSGVLELIYADYIVMWLGTWPHTDVLTWLPQPWNNPAVGGVGIIAAIWLAVDALRKLVQALWLGWRWISFEADGMRWHVADSGETYRIIWVRPNKEYLFDTTIRTHRLNEEMEAQRARKQALIKAAVRSSVSVLAWLAAPILIAAAYTLFSRETAQFLVDG